jgi:hypothetical protein
MMKYVMVAGLALGLAGCNGKPTSDLQSFYNSLVQQ